MAIEKILIEGKSAEIYLRSTMAGYAPSLAILEGRIENPGGWSEMDTRLGELKSEGNTDSVFVVWDKDILARCMGKGPSHLIDHPFSYTFLRDFEEIFPTWMIARALMVYDHNANYPSEAEIDKFCRVTSSEQSFYERLRSCVKTRAKANRLDSAGVDIPSKVQLAEILAKIANITHYQPEEMRRLMNYLMMQISGSNKSWSLIQSGVSEGEFILNSQVIDKWELKGKIALSISQNMWLIDINNLTVYKYKALDGHVSGSPCWSNDGLQIVFPSVPNQKNPPQNGDVIGIYDVKNELYKERLMIGHNLCWDKRGLIYGNSWTGRYQVYAIDPKDPSYWRKLPLADGSLVSCVDRKRDRILIGEQSRYVSVGRFVCSIFRINDGELVWDGATANIALAEWTGGAFSPDGNSISWPVKEQGDFGTTSIWVTDINTSQSYRITPPSGHARSSCWSPDGDQLAFMWSRWTGDPVRVWVAHLRLNQLEPLVEGPLGESSSSLAKLGCHSWV